MSGIRIHRAHPSHPQQGVVSEPSMAKSVKVNNTNLMAHDVAPEKVSKSLQDRSTPREGKESRHAPSDRDRKGQSREGHSHREYSSLPAQGPTPGKEIRSHESRLQERMAERQAEKQRSKGVKVDSDTQTQASVLQGRSHSGHSGQGHGGQGHGSQGHDPSAPQGHTPGPQSALPPGQMGVRMGIQPQGKTQSRSLQPSRAQPSVNRVQSPATRSASPRSADRNDRSHPRHLTADGKEASSSSINSTSSNISSGGDDSNVSSDNSKSNSNNSASSNDSVIFRPSSCDELESGMESDGGYTPSKQQVSHNTQTY